VAPEGFWVMTTLRFLVSCFLCLFFFFFFLKKTSFELNETNTERKGYKVFRLKYKFLVLSQMFSSNNPALSGTAIGKRGDEKKKNKGMKGQIKELKTFARINEIPEQCPLSCSFGVFFQTPIHT